MNSHLQKKSLFRDIAVPVIVWIIVILAFVNIKNVPFEFVKENKVVVRFLAKALMTIIFPLIIIHLFYKSKSDFGIFFPKFSDSFKLAIRAYAIGGPAGMTFMLIGFIGWTYADWFGAITLSVAYSLVFYLIPKITFKLPTRSTEHTPNKGVYYFTLFSFITCVLAYFTYDAIPVISKVLYFIFIVGLGEEMLFRGFIQSSFNRYFGKPYNIAGVPCGIGLFLAALMFGLIHALVVSPPAWPWALFTFVMGLSLGFIREKDGSILSAVLLHAMMDMPLAFFS